LLSPGDRKGWQSLDARFQLSERFQESDTFLVIGPLDSSRVFDGPSGPSSDDQATSPALPQTVMMKSSSDASGLRELGRRLAAQPFDRTEDGGSRQRIYPFCMDRQRWD